MSCFLPTVDRSVYQKENQTEDPIDLMIREGFPLMVSSFGS